MEETVKFSVTIPAYKDKYLGETIDSVLAQTYSNFEVVIVNDASPYDLDSIVAQYDDPRIRYFKNEKNCGARHVVDNWNICLGHATGEYLICMGDDDNLTPRCLADFALLIQKYPQLDLYHARSEIIDDDSRLVCVLEERPEWESVYSLIYNPRNTHLGDWLFKTETLRRNGGFYKLPFGWQSDDLTAFIAAATHGVANTREPGFQYRGNGLSISHDMKSIEDKIEAVRFAVGWRLQFVADSHPATADDRRLAALIQRDAEARGRQDIDDMVEFDIRKDFLSRSWFWLWHRRRHGISLRRYLRCLLKTVKYKLK
ncbi:MAG: glycosyltransferase [Prevotella sp.]|nr:glycosyltransferase [Prevotella sp.]